MDGTLFYFAIISFLFVIAVSEAGAERSYAAARTPLTSRPLSVLLITPPFAGHLLPCLALGEELVKRKHNVTLVSAPTNLVKREITKYNISLWSIGEGFISDEEIRMKTQHMAGRSNEYFIAFNTFSELYDFNVRALKTVNNAAIKSYDVIVGDKDFFISLICLSRKWKIPSVYLGATLIFEPFFLQPWTTPLPNTGHTENLTFLQRLHTYIRRSARYLIFRSICEIYALFYTGICKQFPLCDLPNSAPALVPHIFVSSIGFEFPRLLLPSAHYVGPMISQNQPQLPQHIVEWLGRRQPRSVVYVSMGTTAILTSAQAEMIVNGATRANFSVVWSLRKTNQHILERMTFDRDNVLISEWIPQVTILRHPSIHSAVLHGGLGGIQEALSSGVPLLVAPFLFDQLDNAARVKYYKYGEMIKLHELSTPLVTQKLALIGSELYRKSVKKIQQIYKKDGGASTAANIVEFYSDYDYEQLIPSPFKYKWSWITHYNVDVSLVLIVAVLLLSYLFYRLCTMCYSTICNTRCHVRAS